MERKDELGKVLRTMDPDELRVLVDKMRPHVGNQRTLEYAMEVVDGSSDDFDGDSVRMELHSWMSVSEEEFYAGLDRFASTVGVEDECEAVGMMVRDSVRRLFGPRARRLSKSGRDVECAQLVLAIADALDELDTMHAEVCPDVLTEYAEYGRACVSNGNAMDFFYRIS